jgi:hypothetical protein
VGWRRLPRGTQRPPSDNDTLEFVRPKYHILSFACCMPPQIGMHTPLRRTCFSIETPSEPSAFPLSHALGFPDRYRRLYPGYEDPLRRRRFCSSLNYFDTHTHTHTTPVTRWRYHRMLGQHRRLDWHTLAGARGPAVGDSFLLPLHHHLLGVNCRSTRPCRCPS